MQRYDVAIVGGGASGLSCALALKRMNKNICVAVFDRCARLGKKLAATGNGQGNISNARLSQRNYHGGGAALAGKIIGGDYALPMSLFNCLFSQDAEGRIYPSGRQASALSESLIRELSSLGAQFIHPADVVGIKKGFILSLADGGEVGADRVVLACGGKAQKQFGTDGSSYALAQSFGHKITPLFPSLVQLKTDTAHIRTLKGIRADCAVRAYLGENLLGDARGDVIFTDYGVSGNAIFKISSCVSGVQGAVLNISFLPDVSEDDIARDVRNKIKLGYPHAELLSGTLHNQIGRAVIKRSGASPADIAHTAKNFMLNVAGTLGFDCAQVTRGGIDCRDIDDDMQSKLCSGLYLVGEYVDVDGDCGGYNLLWAFASGMRAARGIAEFYD